MTDVEYTMIWFIQLLTVVVLVALVIKLSELADTIKAIALSVNKLALISQACATYLEAVHLMERVDANLKRAQDFVNGHG